MINTFFPASTLPRNPQKNRPPPDPLALAPQVTVGLANHQFRRRTARQDCSCPTHNQGFSPPTMAPHAESTVKHERPPPLSHQLPHSSSFFLSSWIPSTSSRRQPGRVRWWVKSHLLAVIANPNPWWCFPRFFPCRAASDVKVPPATSGQL